jgi:hypothetical protein
MGLASYCLLLLVQLIKKGEVLKRKKKKEDPRRVKRYGDIVHAIRNKEEVISQ